MKNAIKVLIFTVAFIAVAAGAIFGVIKYNTSDFVVEEGEEKNTVIIQAYSGKSVNIEIPEKIHLKKVVAIGDDAFKRTDIKSVTIPKTVTEIGENAFKSCEKLEKVVLGEKMEVIGEKAFSDCPMLSEIKLPASLEKLSAGAFLGCTSLKNIEVAEDGSFFFDGSVLYSKDKTVAYFIAADTDFSDCSFPKELKTISPYFFFGNKKITSVEIPEGITDVPDDFCTLCTSLKDVKIPDGVKTIGNSAFLGCASIDKLYVPASVKRFEDFCFPVALNDKKSADEEYFNPNFTLVVEKDSSAHRYAIKNNIKYELAK